MNYQYYCIPHDYFYGVLLVGLVRLIFVQAIAQRCETKLTLVSHRILE